MEFDIKKIDQSRFREYESEPIASAAMIPLRAEDRRNGSYDGYTNKVSSSLQKCLFFYQELALNLFPTVSD